MMALRTPDEACIEYAVAIAAVREQTRIMRDNRCPIESGGDRVTSPVQSCLDRYFESVKSDGDPDGDALEELCEACEIRRVAINVRREAKRRLRAAKRSIEVVGKRLNKLAQPPAGQ